MVNSMLNESLFTSGNNEYCTPTYLIKYFGGFDLDLCCTEENKVCEKGCTSMDNVTITYYGKVWCNPPYSTKLQDQAVQKCIELACVGNIVYLLIPCRMNSKRIEKLLKTDLVEEIYLPNKRIKFKGCKNSAPFDCMIVELNKYRILGYPTISTINIDAIARSWGFENEY